MDKKKYSLFIGRWQPLHEGHVALFDKIRQKGGNLLIGIRNTPVDMRNPYNVNERIEMIKEKVPDAEVIVLPDIKGVYFGRKVGYNVEQIHLDKEIEKISATEIRKNVR